jgi:hypothetical protein
MDDPRYATVAGTFSSTSVPAPRSLQTSNCPPKLRARSRIPSRPKWPARFPCSRIVGSMPPPSSQHRIQDAGRAFHEHGEGRRGVILATGELRAQSRE